jgi:HAD superfamily phosphoserine phosphatase-like hydrolase
MKGLNISQILAVADRIPLVEHTADIIAYLKSKGYVTGIITDSYDVVANHIKTKIGADFSLGNELEFSKSVATGEVKIPSFFFNRNGSLCKHNLCKTNAAAYILNKYNIQLNNMVAVGDGANDLCLIRNAGIGVSFCSPNELMNVVADIKIAERSFKTLQDLL